MSAALDDYPDVVCIGAPAFGGRTLISGSYCRCGDLIQPADLVAADFDRKAVTTGGGIYLYVIKEKGEIVYYGARPMTVDGDGVRIDVTGRGEWKTYPSASDAGYEVVGYVETVYRATSLC
jgi:hypothetical protein